MLTEQQYHEMLVAAERRNAKMDRIDHAGGFASPDECEDLIHLSTIASAIEAGMRIQDWQTVAEGQAMLLKMIRSKRQ